MIGAWLFSLYYSLFNIFLEKIPDLLLTEEGISIVPAAISASSPLSSPPPSQNSMNFSGSHSENCSTGKSIFLPLKHSKC